MHRPTIDPTAAVEQAGTTVGQYLTQAHIMLAERFDDQRNFDDHDPNLLAALVAAQVSDFNCVCLTDALYEVAEALREHARTIP